MSVLAIEVQRRHALPGLIRGERDPVIVRLLVAGAVSAIADANHVVNVGAGAVHTDEGAIHFRITICLAGLRPSADLRQFQPVRLLHDQLVQRKRTRVSRIVHLVKHVGGLAQRNSVHINGRRRPRARVAVLVGSLNVEFDDGVVGLRRDHRGENAITGDAVTVQPVIIHWLVREP